VNELLDHPDRRALAAIEARARVEQQFSWTSIARQTLDFYESLQKGSHAAAAAGVRPT
jgi:glycosyltransferase involved in cell wall biosynthesis